MEKKEFLPIGDSSEIIILYNHLKSLNPAELYKPKDCTGKGTLMDMLSKCESKIEEYTLKYNEILDYISKFFGKYIRIKLYARRNSENEWVCRQIKNGFIYRYNKKNSCLFGIYTDVMSGINNDSCFRGGVFDESLNLLTIVKNHKIEIEEITEEEFLKDVSESVNNCIKQRKEKLKKCELTDTGYQFSDTTIPFDV